MSNELELTREKQQIRQPAEGLPENGPACHVSGSGWLKGGFVMAICCARLRFFLWPQLHFSACLWGQ